MTETEARQLVVNALAEIAPDVDPDSLEPAAGLQREADLDSMDMLSLVEAVARDAGIDIPSSHYEQLSSLDDLVTYLCTHPPAARTGAG